MVEFIQAKLFAEINVVPPVASVQIVNIASLSDRLDIITELPPLPDPSSLQASMLAHPVFNECRIEIVLPDLHVIVVVDTETSGVLVHLLENIDPAFLVSRGALAFVKAP